MFTKCLHRGLPSGEGLPFEIHVDPPATPSMPHSGSCATPMAQEGKLGNSLRGSSWHNQMCNIKQTHDVVPSHGDNNNNNNFICIAVYTKALYRFTIKKENN